jgi:hypothetical protein
MEKDEIKLMHQYLNIPSERKKISLTYLPLFIFEAMVIFIYYNNMGFEILVSCAFIIFLSMFILGEYIREKSKFLFLYLGVGSSLLSLC